MASPEQLRPDAAGKSPSDAIGAPRAARWNRLTLPVPRLAREQSGRVHGAATDTLTLTLKDTGWSCGPFALAWYSK